MYKSFTNKKGKGEFFIVGTAEEIGLLAKSQKRYVGEKYDVDGAIASICVKDLIGYTKHNDHFITGQDHDGELKTFKCGSQCSWLWTGSYNRPYSWQDSVCKFMKTQDLSKLYVLSVFFRNGTDILDGNPFIGGTQEKKENLLITAHRELFEEVGLYVKKNAKIGEIPTVSRDICIWIVEAKDVYDAKCNPIEKKK